MEKHVTLIVQGRVQGVWYRASAEQKAGELGLTGFVMNQPDGSVYIEAEGEENALHRFIQWCHEGPILARVDEVKVAEGKQKGFKEFVQRR